MFYGKPLGFFSYLICAVFFAALFGNSIAHHDMNMVAALSLVGAFFFSIAAVANYMQQRS